jgi:hypothetical protein
VASGTLPAMICWSSITPDSCGESPSVSALFDPFDPFAVSSAAPVSSASLVAVPPSRVLLPMSRVALFVALVAFRSVSSRWLSGTLRQAPPGRAPGEAPGDAPSPKQQQVLRKATTSSSARPWRQMKYKQVVLERGKLSTAAARVRTSAIVCDRLRSSRQSHQPIMKYERITGHAPLKD